MRKIAVAIAFTICGLILLFTYPTSTGQTMVAAGALPLGLPPNESSPGSGRASTPAPEAGNTTNGSGSDGASGTFTGSTSDTRYGPVQVQISVIAGRITAATVLQVPSGGRSDRINSHAGPVLDQETVQAQSAQIDTVSGATYTSKGYIRSLQSAIDAAHVG